MHLDFEALSIPASSATTGSQSYDPSAQPDATDEVENSEPVPEETVYVYDEWDFRRRHYRKDWCLLRERDMPAGDTAFYKTNRIPNKNNKLAMIIVISNNGCQRCIFSVKI